MSEEFGKWLKKNKIDSIQIDDKGNTDDVVSVRALGEWHLGMTVKCIEIDKELSSDVINSLGLAHREIAVCCLGVAEVERRLKK